VNFSVCLSGAWHKPPLTLVTAFGLRSCSQSPAWCMLNVPLTLYLDHQVALPILQLWRNPHLVMSTSPQNAPLNETFADVVGEAESLAGTFVQSIFFGSCLTTLMLSRSPWLDLTRQASRFYFTSSQHTKCSDAQAQKSPGDTLYLSRYSLF
jgi:hypothetical protein